MDLDVQICDLQFAVRPCLEGGTQSFGVVLLEQAAVAIGKAVMDGDLGPGDAGKLNGLLEKSLPELNPADLGRAVANMATACALFPVGDMKDQPVAP